MIDSSQLAIPEPLRLALATVMVEVVKALVESLDDDTTETVQKLLRQGYVFETRYRVTAPMGFGLLLGGPNGESVDVTALIAK